MLIKYFCADLSLYSMAKYLNFLTLFTITNLSLLSNQCNAFSYGDPNSLEQAQLELINRARTNPLMEAQRFGLNLYEGITGNAINSNLAQPLSFNSQLLDTSRGHSLDMLQHGYFSHKNQLGQSPFNRMSGLNYNYQSASENIAAKGMEGIINDVQYSEAMHSDLFIDVDYPNRGHRVTMLNPAMREIGIGLAFGLWHRSDGDFNTGILTVDFGVRPNSLPIILGVAYDDTNQDHFYNAGEGIANVSVSISATNSTKTASAGGYGMEVTSFRDYTLTFTHPQLGSVNKNVHVDNNNVKVDVLASEFPHPVSLKAITKNIEQQQCATINQNKLIIPCINAMGQAYVVELGNIGSATNQQFGIQTIALKEFSTATACGSYDAEAAIAHLGCISINNQNYDADLMLKSTPVNPVYELNILNHL